MNYKLIEELIAKAKQVLNNPKTPKKYKTLIQECLDRLKHGPYMCEYGNSYDDYDNCQEFNVPNM